MRQETKGILNIEQMRNLSELENIHAAIHKSNTEWYGQGLLSYMMKSQFIQESIRGSDFSLVDHIKQQIQNEKRGDGDQKAAGDIMGSPVQSNSNDSEQNDLVQAQFLAREKASYAFREVYRREMMELKYEVRMLNTRIVYYLSFRG